MSSSEERLKILRMIQDGKITAEAGVKLIEALETKVPPQAPQIGFTRGSRWLRIRVTDIDTGKIKVNVRLPINLVTAGIKMGARFSPDVEGLDVEQLRQLINSGETGQIVDAYDHRDHEHVEVFVE